MKILFFNHMCDACKKSSDSRVCHKLLVHFVIDRANLFADQRISGLPKRAKYKHFRTIGEDTLAILTRISILLLL